MEWEKIKKIVGKIINKSKAIYHILIGDNVLYKTFDFPVRTSDDIAKQIIVVEDY